jgi:4-diphosphocytidyl-2-C-methyl-D-erythritol kinase
VVLHSYAKLNLYLKVGAKRKDQYHNLATLFERIDLCDEIILKPRFDNQIKIVSDSSQIPKDKSNLAWRAAALIKDTCQIHQGLDIQIIKRIPVGSGMGSGSSNAACVLMGLNKFWRLKLSQKRLMELGRQLGADVPFFIANQPFAMGCRRGDEVSPLKTLANLRFWHILVVPKPKVSTALVYQKWDDLTQKVRLTRTTSNVKILTLALRRKDFSVINKALFNSLEQVSIKLYPEIGRIKKKLLSLGVKSILMSGSGPAVFGIVSSRKEAVSLVRQLKRNSFWQVYVTRTV